jgi:hypothetical protein
MTARTDTHISRTRLRVLLPHPRPPAGAAAARRSGLSIDRALRSGTARGRLLAYHDAVDDTDYVALLVGDVLGARDVPLRFVPEECLLIEGGRSIEAA